MMEQGERRMNKEELGKEAYKEAEKIKEYQTEPNNEYEKGFNNGEVRGYKDGYRDGAEPREKRIAELKEQCSILADCNTCTSTCKTENIEMKRQLTKAKELLKRCYDNYIYLQPLRGDIEQFLNSEVEK